ncbi:kinase-like domain-containing protein, partial [Mycena rebaudengoi]
CQEALIWQQFQHPYILPMLGTDLDSFSPSLRMVSPWMENGTILRYLDDHSRANVHRLLSEIAQGLECLHSRNIVHGDLRGCNANILISDNRSACLADFGLTSWSDATAATHSSNRAGAVLWMAPELIAPDRFGHHKFSRTSASDIYAFGCVCLVVRASLRRSLFLFLTRGSWRSLHSLVTSNDLVTSSTRVYYSSKLLVLLSRIRTTLVTSRVRSAIASNDSVTSAISTSLGSSDPEC